MTLLGALACVIAGLFILCSLIVLGHYATLGWQLERAAGSNEYAKLAIESANLDRLLRAKVDAETDTLMRRGFKRRAARSNNVVPFRIVNHGSPVRFDDDGGRAA